MGCANSSEPVAPLDAVDQLLAVNACQKELPKKRTRKQHSPAPSQSKFLPLCPYSEDPGEKAYQSYIDTPMNAPSGKNSLPDRDMHDAHLVRLNSFLTLVQARPARFERLLEMARQETFSPASNFSHQAWHTRLHKNHISFAISPVYHAESSTDFAGEDSVSLSLSKLGSPSASSKGTYHSECSKATTSSTPSLGKAILSVASKETTPGSFVEDWDDRSGVTSQSVTLPYGIHVL